MTPPTVPCEPTIRFSAALCRDVDGDSWGVVRTIWDSSDVAVICHCGTQEQATSVAEQLQTAHDAARVRADQAQTLQRLRDEESQARMHADDLAKQLADQEQALEKAEFLIQAACGAVDVGSRADLIDKLIWLRDKVAEQAQRLTELENLARAERSTRAESDRWYDESQQALRKAEARAHALEAALSAHCVQCPQCHDTVAALLTTETPR